MVWPPGKHITSLIAEAQKLLINARIVRKEMSSHRALIDLDGQWKKYRIIISEVHRNNGSVRYAYYVLDDSNYLVQGFDNSPDVSAAKLMYGRDWKMHLQEEIPHQHDANSNITPTNVSMTFETFTIWLIASL